MRITFLSGWYPFPPNNGSKLRIFNLLRGLAHHHEISLISFADDEDVLRAAAQRADGQPPESLAAICKRVHVVKAPVYRPAHSRALLSFFQPTPRWLADIYSRDMETQIRAEMQRGCDLVIASQWNMAAYHPIYQNCPAIFEEVELGNLESKRASAKTRLGRLRHTLPLLKMKWYLRQVLRHFRACTVVSSIEAERVRNMAPHFEAIQTIPNGVDLEGYSAVTKHLAASPKEANNLIFTGSFRYDANHDAMQWFVGEVLPRVRAVMPEVKLTITGDHAGLPLPSTDHVTLTGYVDDPRTLLAQAAISIAPLRIGGGTRLKILEAMAVRTPVVATSKGAEGLDARDGEHVLIADTPDAFTQAIFRLLRDAELKRKITENAHDLVRTRYDWRVILPRFLGLIDQVSQVKSVQPIR